jgi:hypothetical protein
VLALETPALGPDVGDGDHRRVVDEDRGVVQLPAASVSRGHAASPIFPVRSFIESMRATEHSMRWTTSSLAISSENMATGLARIATFMAMFIGQSDFPIAGRAAMITRLAGWRPVSLRSRSRNRSTGR